MIAQHLSSERRVLIDDVSKLAIAEYPAFASWTTLCLNAITITGALSSILAVELSDLRCTDVLVTVGRSGATMGQYLDKKITCRYLPRAHIHAFSWDRSGSIPSVTTSAMQWTPLVDPTVRRVIVIDDVISSGRTLELVVQRNSWRFPRAQWYACAWITRKRKLRGYAGVMASALVTNCYGQRVPINSLSTLLKCSDIATSYAERHFGERAGEFLSTMRSLGA
jgi:orotate phosphoribosyltransferase-like protein